MAADEWTRTVQTLTGLLDGKEKGDPTEEEPAEDGAVWVTDGVIGVKNPKGRGKYPVLVKGPMVRLWVDGEEVLDRQIVTEESEIRYELESFPSEAKMTITFSPDQVEAYLNLNFVNGIEYRLVDQRPRQTLRLEAEYAREVEPARLTLQDVQDKAKAMGITVPLETEMVLWALKERKSGYYLLAKGRKAVHGVDERLLFPSRESKGKADDGKEVIDYRDRGEIPSVEMGELVAVKSPLKPGEPGLTVKGEVLPAREGVVLEVVEGLGIKAMEGGRKFVATTSGRPSWNPLSKVLEILPQYEVKGNVDMNTGNIVFRGDVHVLGHIVEGFKVKATGLVSVEGSVFGGAVEAGSHIKVNGNVISARIEAGGEGAILKHALAYLIPLKNMMYDCHRAIGELKKNQSFSSVDLKITGDGNLIKLLIDIKFREIPAFVRKLRDLARSREEMDRRFAEMMERLDNCLVGLGPLQFVTADEFKEVYEEVNCLVDHIQQLVSHQANVTVRTVQNSTVRATGSIFVTGRGSVNSYLYAGEDVLVKGAFRGGLANAARNVVAGELGSEAEVQTQAQVGANGRIVANKVYTGVLLNVDRFHTRNMRIGYGMNCYYDKDRGIVVEMEREEKDGTEV